MFPIATARNSSATPHSSAGLEFREQYARAREARLLANVRVGGASVAHGNLKKPEIEAALAKAIEKRADIVYRGNKAVLSVYRFGNRETWLLTAFEKKDGSGGAGGDVAPSDPTRAGPTLTRPDAGAEPSENVGPGTPPGKPRSVIVEEMDARAAVEPGERPKPPKRRARKAA